MKARKLQVSVFAIVAVAASLAFVYGFGVPGSDGSSGPAQPAEAASVSTGNASWNPNVGCSATVTTLGKILGTQTSAQGGATYAGGAFKPGIPDRRSFSPPCVVNGVPTFVELHNVSVGACAKINADGDWTCGLTDPNVPASVSINLKKIHIETGTNYRTAGGWSVPPGGKRIDIQGFVFWDPGHTTEAWHMYSGWEIHNFTAWRLTGTGSVTGPAHDFTGDGHADVLARDPSGNVRSYAGTGAGGFTAGHTTAATGMSGLDPLIDGGDWSGDGRNDAIGRDTAGNLLMYAGTATGLAASPVTLATGWGSVTMLAGDADLTSDGKPDLVVRTATGELMLHRGDGAGGFGAVSTIGAGWQGMTAILSVGDFNGDGRSDIVSRGSTGDLYLYPGDGAGGLTSGRITIGSRWNELTAMVAAGDFSGDGHPDIIGRNSRGDLLLYRGNGAGRFGTVSTIGFGWGGLTILG
ncbi:MAG: VCBS repeat-containing protein [Mycobacteriales bacterium]